MGFRRSRCVCRPRHCGMEVVTRRFSPAWARCNRAAFGGSSSQKLVDGPPAAGGWLLRLLLPLGGGTTLLLSARCAANCAAPSQIRRPALPGSICGEDVPPKRWRICDGPPKSPGGVGQRWPRRAINSFQNLPEKQKRTRLNALLVFPCCRAGATPLVRWAFLFLASRFASPPYLAPGSGLCEASPAVLPFAPSGRVRREYTTAAFY